jgi:acyl-CoA synthetase (AMP-forming)/AMP-acid ligase II
MNTAKRLCHFAERNQSKIAIIDGQRRYTFMELSTQIDVVSEQLRILGLVEMDCVLIDYPLNATAIILMYAAWNCGACLVPVSDELSSHDKQTICKSLDINALVLSRSTVADFADLASSVLLPCLPDALFAPYTSPSLNPPEYYSEDAAIVRVVSDGCGLSYGLVRHSDLASSSLPGKLLSRGTDELAAYRFASDSAISFAHGEPVDLNPTRDHAITRARD